MASTFHSPLPAGMVRPPDPGASRVRPGGVHNPGPLLSAKSDRQTTEAQRLLAERNRLLAAGMVVLQRCGDFKVETVLRQAGLSTRSFYRHFEKKNDLLVALFELGLTDIAAGLRRVTTAADTPPEKIRAWAATVIGIPYRQNMSKRASTYAANLRHLRSEYPDIVQRCAELSKAPLVEAISEGRTGGQLGSDDPAADGEVIFQLVTSMAADQAVTRRAIPREEIERAVMPFISRAIEMC
ncbi:TetR/AcrR family transcriptional regulator [Mycobacterium sp. SMC-15]|uniref:TetR/AcrR family transcriptional regulator n=1 Tax=Mycobacterium sp. SMC-15 TaxID=3381627 RepID=UPI003876C5D8